ncbi:MAG: cell division protein FtsQ [Lachnospiraceae bacterium]|nr:cell division protein FtsQ [Lachnospiraceae bacterium]
MSKKSKIVIFISVTLMLILVILVLAVQRIDDKDIFIEGNKKYTKEEMIQYIFDSKWDRNPFVLFYNTKFKEIKEIPFVDTYEVEILSLDSVKVTVYEKKMIGYVTYMGTNMYFDKDGMVVENSVEVIEGIPPVTGLEFDRIVLNEKIPVEDEEVFDVVLDITQALDKYEIIVDKIYISEDNEVTLFKENIEVMLGKNKDINDKVRSLNDMMPKLEGLNGTLDIREYNENNTGYTFKKKN